MLDPRQSTLVGLPRKISSAVMKKISGELESSWKESEPLPVRHFSIK